MAHVPEEGATLSGRTALAIFAHPDDESLACGGTLARLADSGVRVVLMCASRGERGSTTDPTLAGATLGAARTDELHEAAKVLGASAVIILDHPDGSLRWADVDELHEEILNAVKEYSPDLVITFDEDGLYWHDDHIGMYERTQTAIHTLGPAGPVLYYVTMPPGVMRDLTDTAVAEGWVPPGSTPFGIAPGVFGLETDIPTLAVDVSAWVPRKLDALRCHRTQMGPTNPFARLDPAQARRWIGIERFRRDPFSVGGSLLEQIGEPVLSS